ncbi:hypothetical protein TNCV_4293801 [Trichonephila clavipes]|uniref:Uncharacterized protein n=1 Tax=Trichonephila clavipes TaxID=2585209 RepID=A0A8X6RPY5_TRICX|nr:hypothetical protein TNCV_4293801 [Trichonephila clavipes]
MPWDGEGGARAKKGDSRRQEKREKRRPRAKGRDEEEKKEQYTVVQRKRVQKRFQNASRQRRLGYTEIILIQYSERLNTGILQHGIRHR